MASEPPTITASGDTPAVTPDATPADRRETPSRTGHRDAVAAAGSTAACCSPVPASPSGSSLVGLGLIVSVTGDEATHLPDEIEEIAPVPDAVQVLSQTSVFVDLITDYTGVLVIDGVEIETIDLSEIDSSAVEPGQQVDIPPATVYEPGNATLSYTPTEGAPIETFETGLHHVQVIYWRVEEGRSRAGLYAWTFNVI